MRLGKWLASVVAFQSLVNTSTAVVASLNGARAQIKWAGKRLGDLERTIESFQEVQHDAIRWEFDLGRPGEIKFGMTQ